jgi:eukaryotic-like serine/threonine-protein kinase
MDQRPQQSDTINVARRQQGYQCACGRQWQPEAELPESCDACGRQIRDGVPSATMTVSFAADPEEDVGYHLRDGPDRSGEEIGHFRLLAQMGQGGMGAVYRALDESLQREVAVKVIRTGDETNSLCEQQVTRLLNEAIAQARLNHPNVITIYYVGREDEEPFLAMELLPGPTLAKAISEGPLPYKEVIRFARQVASALELASRMGLVHGDIKPSNLILADDHVVKLSDFGLAHIEQQSVASRISGTLNYLAPEVAAGGDPSPQSDMYSLGVTLFELTFGYRPYNVYGDTIHEQISNSQDVQVAFPEKWPSTIPDRWRHVLERLLARAPQDRYADYEEFDSDLRALAPVGVTTAGLLNRSVALLLDYLVQAVLLLPLILVLQLPQLASILNRPALAAPWTESLRWLGLLAPLVPAAFAWMEWRGWRTPGRYLFQLRVADSHGLRLGGRKRVLRSVIRNIVVWFGALTIILMTLGLEEVAVVVNPLDEVILLINTLPVLGPRRRAVHDRLFGSRVVLDTSRGTREDREL